MSKGQIAGQIFIYIMAVIVIGVIIVIGYGAIKNTLAKSCQVEQITFKQKMESSLERFSSFGTLRKETFSTPCNYDKVCFVSADAVNNNNVLGGPINLCANTLIKNSVIEKEKNNIFVVSGQRTIPIGYSELVKAQLDNCTCITQRNDNLYITFKGEGSRTFVSETS